MTPKLYMRYASPPVRSVLLCAEALGLKLELKEVDLFGGEHLKPEYLKVSNYFVFISNTELHSLPMQYSTYKFTFKTIRFSLKCSIFPV